MNLRNLIILGFLCASSVFPQTYASRTANRLARGTGVPSNLLCASSADVGKVFIRTDAAAANDSVYVCNNTGVSTYNWELLQGSGGAGVTAYNGRVGTVSPAANDYNFTMIGGLLAASQLPAVAVRTDQANTYSAGKQDFSAAGQTLPVKSGTTSQSPTTCTASKELYIRTDATPGQQLFICNATGNGWVLVGDGAPNGTGVTLFNGRAGAVVPASGDYTAAQVTNAVDQTGSYANPAWITSLSGAKITTGQVPAANMTPMAASGTGHSAGIVPDPGGVAGTTKYLREDGSWATPAGAGTVTNTGGALTAGNIMLGNGVNDSKVSGASIDGSNNMSTPGTITAGAGAAVNGKICYSGSTSGTACITVASVAGTPADLQLPTITAPAPGVLVSNGASPQVTSWYALTGTGTKVLTGTGTYTAGHIASIDSNGNVVDSGSAAGVGSVTNSLGALGAGQMILGNGGADVKQAGVTVPTSPGADTVLGTSTSGVGQWASMPNCTDTGGNHLNYSTSTHTYSCGTSGGGGGGGTFFTVNLHGGTVPGSTTQYVDMGGGSLQATEANAQIIMPAAGTLKNMYVHWSSTQPAGGSLLCQVFLNGIGKSLAVSLGSGFGPTDSNDTFDTVAVVAGDKVDVACQNASGSTSAGIQGISMQLQ